MAQSMWVKTLQSLSLMLTELTAPSYGLAHGPGHAAQAPYTLSASLEPKPLAGSCQDCAPSAVWCRWCTIAFWMYATCMAQATLTLQRRRGIQPSYSLDHN